METLLLLFLIPLPFNTQYSVRPHIVFPVLFYQINQYRRGANVSQNENIQIWFSRAIRELRLGKLLRKANIRKPCDIPAYEVFQFLLLLVFQGKNMFRFPNSKRKDLAVSKNTYYRFLNETSFKSSCSFFPPM